MALSTPDPHALLCERCGYPIDGFAAVALCPECATPVRESLPQRRVGTPWQRGPSVRALLATAWATIRRPGETFRALRVSMDRPTRSLLAIYLSLGTIVPVTAWVVLAIRQGGWIHYWYERSTGPGVGTAATMDSFSFPSSVLGILAMAWVLLLGLFFLTEIETLGVRFFGRRRQWRVTKPIAWSVCSHAAIGWAIGGLLHALSPLAVLAARPLFDLLPPATAVQVATEAATWTPIGALFCGMLIFETLVYIGVRACRYANEPRPV